MTATRQGVGARAAFGARAAGESQAAAKASKAKAREVTKERHDRVAVLAETATERLSMKPLRYTTPTNTPSPDSTPC